MKLECTCAWRPSSPQVSENRPADGLLEVVAHVHAESAMANLTDVTRIFVRTLAGIEAPQDRVVSGRVRQVSQARATMSLERGHDGSGNAAACIDSASAWFCCALVICRGARHVLANTKKLLYVDALQIEVMAEPPARVVVDGEPAGETPLAARVVPGALQVLVPAPGAENDNSVGVVAQVVDAVRDVAEKVASEAAEITAGSPDSTSVE
jgi:hypothetical protein